MKRASLVVTPFLHNNKAITDGPHNRDDTLRNLILLREMLAKHNIILATSDIHPPATSDVVIHQDVNPANLPPLTDKAKHILYVYESPAINPHNANPEYRARFGHIYTWEDDKADGTSTFPLHYGLPWPKPIFNVDKILAAKTHPACTIAGFKRVNYAGELYSAREAVIRWYEKNAPTDFNLYGMGWNTYTFTGLLRLLNRVPLARQLMAPRWPLWRGPVANKADVLAQHKFAYCFENAEGTVGYITEKPFDVMFAGCVPIYRGAPNIHDFIPPTCLIRADAFPSQAALHRYIATMPEAEYRTYLENISTYLKTNASGPFTAHHWATTLSNACISVIKNI
ncbi:MAG: glycosyltransferase family 10 [Alphaproteobacteria bacterium]